MTLLLVIVVERLFGAVCPRSTTTALPFDWIEVATEPWLVNVLLELIVTAVGEVTTTLPLPFTRMVPGPAPSPAAVETGLVVAALTVRSPAWAEVPLMEEKAEA